MNYSNYYGENIFAKIKKKSPPKFSISYNLIISEAQGGNPNTFKTYDEIIENISFQKISINTYMLNFL